MESVTTISDEQIARLPQWAKTHIRVLQDRLESAEAHLRTLQTGENTNVHYSALMEDFPLPPNSRITYDVGHTKIHISSRVEGELEITCDDALVVAPKASNAIVLRPVSVLVRKKP